MPDHSLFRLRVLPCCVALAMSGSYVNAWAENEIQFDSRFLELKGDTKIDLKRFSSQGYVEPGKYNLQVQLNKQPLTEEYDIYWYASENDASKTYACLTPELVAQFGLKEDVAKNLQWIHDGKCLKPGQLEGIDIKADLSQSALVISLPQAYLEYTDINWDPPSRWDDGISGLIADYSITAQTRHEENGGDDSNEISGNGTVGVNLGAWRLRADWQTDYLHSKSNDDDVINGDDTQKNWEWSRYYAWRALPSLKAKLGLGEDYLNSDIFDGFNYVGGSISTDDQMLPPNLRGYAPDISGVAHTTAKVTVSQLGRVIYETQVPAGPFRIQDLGDSVSGTRLMIDADGVAGVPVEGNGAAVYTNMFGKAVVADVNNYYRNQAYIDLNNLPENAEATQSVVQATLTEGAIGYRKFSVISGQKAMAVLRLQDGSYPPFGAEVKNDSAQNVGLVDDDGNVYLAGVKPGEHMIVSWGGVAHCDIHLPDPLPADLFNGLLLPCQQTGAISPSMPHEIKPVIQEQTQQVMPTEAPVSVSAN
ncbi:fimbria/pilus outer membrane usher protein [Escherichia coli]|nr:fimbria/pilus outer membrane usher protein [Escherichia coli]